MTPAARLQRTDAAARHALDIYDRRADRPPLMDREDALAIARTAAWAADRTYEEGRGCSWRSFVTTSAIRAVAEACRRCAYGRPRSGRALLTVPLDGDLAAQARDPSDAFAAADARLTVDVLRRLMQPAQWELLRGAYLCGLSRAEYARAIGRSEARVQQRLVEARREAREVLTR